MQEEIILLFEQRDEKALELLEENYKSYCFSIIQRILESREDAEECWNDVLSKAWTAIPPAKPKNLRLWLGKVARNSALTMMEAENTQKRKGITVQLEELSECIPAPLAEKEADSALLREFMQNFIKKTFTGTQKSFYPKILAL